MLIYKITLSSWTRYDKDKVHVKLTSGLPFIKSITGADEIRDCNLNKIDNTLTLHLETFTTIFPLIYKILQGLSTRSYILRSSYQDPGIIMLNNDGKRNLKPLFW